MRPKRDYQHNLPTTSDPGGRSNRNLLAQQRMTGVGGNGRFTISDEFVRSAARRSGAWAQQLAWRSRP
jgi:hypothetical protein